MTSKEYRTKMSLTLSDVSVMTGFHPSSICKWENGVENMPQEYVDNFKKAYSVDIEKQVKCHVTRKELKDAKEKYDKEISALASENYLLKIKLNGALEVLKVVSQHLHKTTEILEKTQSILTHPDVLKLKEVEVDKK